MYYTEQIPKKETGFRLKHGEIPQKGMRIDFEQAKRATVIFLENAVNYLDTDYPYQNGESKRIWVK